MAVKNLNRIKVMLAERNQTNKLCNLLVWQK